LNNFFAFSGFLLANRYPFKWYRVPRYGVKIVSEFEYLTSFSQYFLGRVINPLYYITSWYTALLYALGLTLWKSWVDKRIEPVVAES
jgi:hypothetical protein